MDRLLIEDTDDILFDVRHILVDGDWPHRAKQIEEIRSNIVEARGMLERFIRERLMIEEAQDEIKEAIKCLQ